MECDATDKFDKQEVETIQNEPVDGSTEPLSEESLFTEINYEECISSEHDEPNKTEENKTEENTPSEETAATASNTRDGVTIPTEKVSIEVDCEEEMGILVDDTMLEDNTRIEEEDRRADSAIERGTELYIEEIKKAIAEKKDSKMKTRIEEIEKAEKAAIELV